MDETRIILSALWVSLMLIYLLGDVLRIFSGDFTAGEIEGQQVAKGMYLGIALIMLIPIVMVVVSLVMPFPAIRWVTIVVAALLFVFNLAGLPYPSAYDNFLIVVSFAVNAITIWYAWFWAG